MSQLSVDFFPIKWIDTSTISSIDFGEHFTNYQVARTQGQRLDNDENKNASVVIHYSQSRKSNSLSYAINSLDLVLGLVGGFSSIVLVTMQIVLGGFENFRLQNTLIRHFYWTKPSS